MAQCISRPRVTYNGVSSGLITSLMLVVSSVADTLEQSSGECSICLEDMLPGGLSHLFGGHLILSLM